jgi:hypothetical protein
LISGIDALTNITFDDFNAKLVVRSGGIEMLLESMKSHDWDQQLIDSSIKLLAIFIDDSSHKARILENEGVALLQSIIESHADHPEVLIATFQVISKICREDEDICLEFGRGKIVRAVYDAVDNNIEDIDTVICCIEVLSDLTSSDEVNIEIAELGMHSLMSILKQYSNDEEVLVKLFTLFSYIAFVTSNLRIIVQYNGISLIVDALVDNVMKEDVLDKAVRTLDAICMANEEYRDMVEKEGGEEIILEIISQYPKNQELSKVCKSTLVTIKARKTKIAAMPKHLLASLTTADGIASPLDFRHDIRGLEKDIRKELVDSDMMTSQSARQAAKDKVKEEFSAYRENFLVALS